MDSIMRCERTYDEELVRSLITREDIWGTIAEDGQDIDDFTPDCESDCWLLMTESSNAIGLYNLHPHNSCTLEIHAHVMPEWRKIHSDETGRLALQWIVDNAPSRYQKIIAQVPEIYPNVRAFCEKNGFVLEGTNRQSYRKNDVIMDQWLLGITRQEILSYKEVA